MEFSQPKGIYQQIADQMRDRILAGEWHEGERIPSVRELAVGVGVNPNTVTKSYQALLDREIIENQRGLGYFVAADAKRRIVDQMREEFVRDELPRICAHDARARHESHGSRAVFCEVERRAYAMRNSQRAVVAALGVVVVVMLGVVTWLRLNAEAAPELSGERSSRTYDLTRSTASRSAASGRSRSSAATRGASRSTCRRKSSMTCASSSMATTLSSFGFERRVGGLATTTTDPMRARSPCRRSSPSCCPVRRSYRSRASTASGSRSRPRVRPGSGPRESVRHAELTMSGAGSVDLDEVSVDGCGSHRQRCRERTPAHGGRPAHGRYVGRRQPRVSRHGQRAERVDVGDGQHPPRRSELR